ncbi:MAG: SGNH/GDSL hydrolase family protein [Candidatus Omnitrophica bacterium]|nr:SGNH/GDSL hydrolase family protein [Candidatus Omnitrophota bacterium]
MRAIPFEREYYGSLRYERDPAGGYRLRPGQRLPHVTINQWGYRGRPWRGTERVLLLGDSVTFGVGATSDEARFSRYLELSTGEPVADASVRAYRVFQHYRQMPLLMERLPRLERVVVWFGYADLLFWVISGGRVEGTFRLEERRGPLQLLRRAAAAGKKLFRVGSAASSTGKAGLEDLTDHMVIFLAAMRDLLAVRQISMLLLIQPFLRKEPVAPHLKARLHLHDRKIRQRFGRGWVDLSEAFVRLLTEGLERGRFDHWIDCQPLVCESDFLDEVHLREASMERMAGVLAKDQILSPQGGQVWVGR